MTVRRRAFFDSSGSVLSRSDESDCDHQSTDNRHDDDGSEEAIRKALVERYPRESFQLATKNAAWLFLQYLCGKEVNMKWAEGTGYLPTRNSVLTTDEGVAFLEEKPAFQCIFDNLNLINPRIQNAAWSELATTWKNYMDVMINQNGNVEDESKDMVVEINEILEDHA